MNSSPMSVRRWGPSAFGALFARTIVATRRREMKWIFIFLDRVLLIGDGMKVGFVG